MKDNRTEFEKKIDKQNEKITHILWIIFLSSIVSILTTLALMAKF